MNRNAELQARLQSVFETWELTTAEVLAAEISELHSAGVELSGWVVRSWHRLEEKISLVKSLAKAS